MAEPPAWHEKYPKPQTDTPAAISKDELLARMKSGETGGKDFVVVDLRRNDHEGGAVHGSINLPAQSLYNSLPTLLRMCQAGGIRDVIFYCGSSRGRGTRAAGWFADLIEQEQVEGVHSMILEGGIKGWTSGGDEFTKMMDEYDAKAWRRSC